MRSKPQDSAVAPESASAEGVTASDAREALDVPTELVAVTVKV